MKSRAMFVGGTASHVGKSWMCTAICRHLRRRGLRVAPFKAQNMSNNSFPCSNGGEIGRAQVVQAEACGLDPEPDMNPVLLKPTSIKGSQVVVNGKVWQNLPAD
jgi:adenosylcobyric acid synthase